MPLFFSALLHTGFLLALLLITSGLFEAKETETLIKDPHPIRLVYFMSPGPGGGGGGGGLKMPELPKRAERQAPPKAVHKINSPVPPVRKTPPPPRPAPDPPKPL